MAGEITETNEFKELSQDNQHSTVHHKMIHQPGVYYLTTDEWKKLNTVCSKDLVILL